jgi:hypothetical protein
MGQRFYLDEENLNEQLEKLDNNLGEMLEFAYLHEDMITTINTLMSDWAKGLDVFQKIQTEWDEMSDDDKKYYDEIDEWLDENGRWWLDEFYNMSDEDKKSFILRYRLTIATCLDSDSYDEETIKEEIEEYWEYEMV